MFYVKRFINCLQKVFFENQPSIGLQNKRKKTEKMFYYIQKMLIYIHYFFTKRIEIEIFVIAHKFLHAFINSAKLESQSISSIVHQLFIALELLIE